MTVQPSEEHSAKSSQCVSAANPEVDRMNDPKVDRMVGLCARMSAGAIGPAQQAVWTAATWVNAAPLMRF